MTPLLYPQSPPTLSVVWYSFQTRDISSLPSFLLTHPILLEIERHPQYSITTFPVTPQRLTFNG